MYIVEDRRTVKRPRRTWLESVEANVAELEINRDVHDRKKWRKIVMKRKSSGPMEGACSMVVPAMNTRPRTSAL